MASRDLLVAVRKLHAAGPAVGESVHLLYIYRESIQNVICQSVVVVVVVCTRCDDLNASLGLRSLCALKNTTLQRTAIRERWGIYAPAGIRC